MTQQDRILKGKSARAAQALPQRQRLRGVLFSLL
jgi:hypothetical protein